MDELVLLSFNILNSKFGSISCTVRTTNNEWEKNFSAALKISESDQKWLIDAWKRWAKANKINQAG